MKKMIKQFVNKQLRYSPYFYARLRAVQKLEEMQPSEVKSLQTEKLVSLIHKAYRESSFYFSLYNRHGVNINKIKTIDDLKYLPEITKYDVVPNRDQIFIGNRFNKSNANTSGTSGYTVRVFRDYQSTVEEAAYQWAQRIKFGHHPGMKTVVVRANLNLHDKELYDPFTKTLYLSSYHLKAENAEWYFKKIADFKPNAIFAYPSSLESLASFFSLLPNKVKVPVIFTSSETLYSYQREKIEAVFSSRIVDWYGNAERTIALQEQEDGLYDQIPLYSVNDFKEDHIITTSLINFSFPLIKYKVDDIIVMDEFAVDKYSAKRAREIQGRSDDVLILPDGTRIGLLCGAFDGVEHVLFSQIVQEDQYTFYVNVVTTHLYNGDDEALLRKQLEEYIGVHIPYTIRYVTEDEIIKSKSGKFKLIVNTMKTNNVSLV